MAQIARSARDRELWQARLELWAALHLVVGVLSGRSRVFVWRERRADREPMAVLP